MCLCGVGEAYLSRGCVGLPCHTQRCPGLGRGSPSDAWMDPEGTRANKIKSGVGDFLVLANRKKSVVLIKHLFPEGGQEDERKGVETHPHLFRSAPTFSFRE